MPTQMPLTTAQHRRARDLFEAALDRDPAELLAWLNRDPAEVARWLEATVPDDPQVRAEVQSLLLHHSRAGSFLDTPIAEAAPELPDDLVLTERAPLLERLILVEQSGRGLGDRRVEKRSRARVMREQ